MKRFTALFLATVMALSLCACGAKDPLADTTWVNVNDGDSYTFAADGTGTHDGKEITYTLEGSTLSITEGAAAPAPSVFTLDDPSAPTRLSPESVLTYYVPAEEYESIGTQVRDENIATLLSCEFWSSTRDTSYTQFLEGGSGWLLVPGTTLPLSWEMVDNNTVTSTINNNGTILTTTLDIVSTSDQPVLVDPATFVVMWKPKM